MLAELQAARELVAAGWCTESGAKDKFGYTVHPTSRDAVRFCAVGAIIRAVEDQEVAVKLLLAELGITDSNFPTTRLAAYNDTHTQAEVVALFDKAIKHVSK